MNPELLSDESGIRRVMHWDDANNKLVVQSTQDPTEILDWNRALFNAERASSALWDGRTMVKVASIPNILIEQWRKKGLNFYHKDDRARILAMLSTNEYSGLRTAPGRLA